MNPATFAGRSSGVLLHPTSLPGSAAVGTLGGAAVAFVDWLADAGQSWWQVLPLVAVDAGGSPYNGLSAFAGNPLLLDAGVLARNGLLTSPPADTEAAERVDYGAAALRIDEVLTEVQRTFRAGAAVALREELAAYRERNAAWLGDWSLFRALRDRFDAAAWTDWPDPLRDREPHALAAARAELRVEVERHELAQLLFDRQWAELRAYAAGRGVRVIGDIPIFVAHDSADVWAHRELFQLDRDGLPTVISGVPPDYFSETGQRWGNPLYDWPRHRETGYRWWIERFRRTLEWVDVVRVDHFRGFESYWEIRRDAPTAVEGRWREGPGRRVFDAVRAELGELPIIAEDLGLITPEVEALRDELHMPGMRVLEFGFDGDPDNPHLPENYPENAVAYTGTHDNDTIIGWWSTRAAEERERVLDFVRPDEELHWALIELVLASRAKLAVVPAQDLLGLGSEARMNTPGTKVANWSWRLRAGQLDPELRDRLRELTRESDRFPKASGGCAPNPTNGP